MGMAWGAEVLLGAAHVRGGTHTWGALSFSCTLTRIHTLHSLIHSLANHTHRLTPVQGHTLARTPLHTFVPSRGQAPEHRSPAWTSPFLSLPCGPWEGAPGGEAFPSASTASSVSILGSLTLSPKLRKALSPSLLPECHSLHCL